MHFLSEISLQTYVILIGIYIITYVSNFQTGYQTGIWREIPFTDREKREFVLDKRTQLKIGSFITTTLSCVVTYFRIFIRTPIEYADTAKIIVFIIFIVLTVMAYSFGKRKHRSHPYDWEKDMGQRTTQR